MAHGTQCTVTPDGRFTIGDHVTITLDWAHQLCRHVYDGRKTVNEIRAERTGTVAEIWTGGVVEYQWVSVRVKCAAARPWVQIDDLEAATPPVPDDHHHPSVPSEQHGKPQTRRHRNHPVG